MLTRPCRWIAGVALAWLLADAHAQTLDEVSLRSQGGDTVARVSFNANVRFVQQAPTAPASLYRLSIEITLGDDSVMNQSTDETRSVRGNAGAPDFTLTLEAARGRRQKQLTLQLAANADVRVRQGPSPRTIDIVFAGFGAGGRSAAASGAAQPPLAERRFAVTLQSVPIGAMDRVLPIPNLFDRYEVFNTNSVVDGVTTFEVNIGYFATQQQAEAVRLQALARFPTAVVLDLEKRRDVMLKSAAAEAASAPAAAVAAAPAAATPPPTPTPTPPTPPAPATDPIRTTGTTSEAQAAVESRAAELMQRAREALAAKRNEEAIGGLNQLLLLPPNRFSQEAQELIGVAWERVGDMRRARVEYELYMRLFPEGDGARRVSQRLAALEGGTAEKPSAEAGGAGGASGGASASAAAPAANAPERGNRFTGNIAQYYYGGKARSESLVNIAAGIDQSTLTKTTESALVTSVDLGGRYATADSETRVVLRGTNSANLSSTSHNQSVFSAGYVDYKRTSNGLAVRLGRQSSISGGLLGVFDGVSLTYPVAQGWKVDLMGGVPANPVVSAPSERLLAAMVETDGLFERWGGDVYFIDQTTEGIANRRAIGTEVRYADENLSIYSLLDYDALFREINAVTLQGSLQAPGQTTVTLLVDSRKAPSLQMTNALISSGATSLKTLLQMQSLEQVRAAALATTAQAKQALISVSRPLSQKWQLAMDVRYSEIGALPAVGNFEATPATGSQYGATLQLTGSNLYSSRDINNFNVSVLTSSQFKGVQLSYNNLTGLRNNDITLEPSIRFYTQRDNQGVKLYRITPGLRATYRLSSKASLLGEGILEHSRTDGAGSYDNTNSIFFYVGYRYELF